jgi:hypothetical protein
LSSEYWSFNGYLAISLRCATLTNPGVAKQAKRPDGKKAQSRWFGDCIYMVEIEPVISCRKARACCTSGHEPYVPSLARVKGLFVLEQTCAIGTMIQPTYSGRAYCKRPLLWVPVNGKVRISNA